MYRGTAMSFLQKQNMYGGSLHVVDTEQSCEPFFFLSKESPFRLCTVSFGDLLHAGIKLQTVFNIAYEFKVWKRKKNPPLGYGF